MKQHTTHTVTAPDMVANLTSAVVESHLRIDYASESTYIDALAAAAWDSIEDRVGEPFGTSIMSTHQSELPKEFTLPVDASRLGAESAVVIQYWNASGVLTAYDTTKIKYSKRGYPTYVTVLDFDEELQEGRTMPFEITTTVAAKTVPASLEQAFLMLMGHLYENRQGVVDARRFETPMAVQYLCDSHTKSSIRWT